MNWKWLNMVKSLKTLQTDSASVSASNNPLKVAGVTDVSFAPQVSTFGSLAGSWKWVGGVLAPNGKIYGIPSDATKVLEIDPVAKTTTTFGSLAGSIKWRGGVLALNGKIYGTPYSSTTVLEIDPTTKTATTFGSFSSTGEKWNGGVLAPNGKIYGIPYSSTTVLEIDVGSCYEPCDWALSPLINKF